MLWDGCVQFPFGLHSVNYYCGSRRSMVSDLHVEPARGPRMRRDAPWHRSRTLAAPRGGGGGGKQRPAVSGERRGRRHGGGSSSATVSTLTSRQHSHRSRRGAGACNMARASLETTHCIPR